MARSVTHALNSTDLAPEALRARLRGWLFARVLIVTVFLGAVAGTHVAPDSDPNFPLRGITGLIVLAYAFSAASAYGVARIDNLRVFALAQVVFDILLNSIAVLLTGALESPMGVWYNLAIIGAAFLLLRHGAYTAAALSSLTYGTLMNLVYYHALPSVLGFAPPPPAHGPRLWFITSPPTSPPSSRSPSCRRSSSSVPPARSESCASRRRTSSESKICRRCWFRTSRAVFSPPTPRASIKSANQAIETIIGRPGASSSAGESPTSFRRFGLRSAPRA